MPSFVSELQTNALPSILSAMPIVLSCAMGKGRAMRLRKDGQGRTNRQENLPTKRFATKRDGVPTKRHIRDYEDGNGNDDGN